MFFGIFLENIFWKSFNYEDRVKFNPFATLMGAGKKWWLQEIFAKKIRHMWGYFSIEIYD